MLHIKNISYNNSQLLQRHSDGTEQLLYQGHSYCECLFVQRTYEKARAAANVERPEVPEKFAGGYDIIHITNRPPYA